MMASRNEGMEKLIPIVNKLQDVCSQMKTTLQFDWPQIAVIGSQSAGKSSVLENIIGRDFLPRGNGIVTRRPLILQLMNATEEYGEFTHKKGKRFTDFGEIRKEIVAETDRTVGTNGKKISSDPINLRIYSPNVLDLTLVDLPGIVKVPVGDQPANIEEQIREMILEFIRKENCLILAVSPANYDLANSDALKLAKEVDEDGLRTIGVITKLDLMDEGTDARDIFDGKLVRLRRGFIGVVNRSQEDVKSKKNMAKTLEDEVAFIKKHYCDIADRLGTRYLQKVLNEQLTEHIRKTVGRLQDETREQMASLKKDMAIYKELHPDNPSSMKVVMLKLYWDFKSNFEKEICSLGSDDVPTDRRSHGAQIRRIYHERLPDEISKIRNDEDELRKEIVNVIDSAYGIYGVMNAPFKAFEALVKEQISWLEEPINVCIDLVLKELRDAVRSCARRISTYPKIRDHIEYVIMSFIHRDSKQRSQNILSLVKMESAYMNSMHYEFKNDKGNGLAVHEGVIFIEDETVGPCRWWSVLKSNTFSCYDVDDHNSEYFTIPLDGLKFRLKRKEDDPTENKQKIVLFKPGGGHIHQDNQEVEFSCASISDIHSWMKSLSKVMDRLDPLEKDVDDLHEKITSYMRIVKKTMCDMVPKAITLFTIRELEDFVKFNLLKELTDVIDDKELNIFAVDEAQAEEFEKMERMYKTCEEALKIMRI